MKLVAAITIAPLLAGCGERLDGAADAAIGPHCDEPAREPPARQGAANIHHGNDLPTEISFAEGQLLALGTFGRCTGTLIGSHWVLSAEHCVLRPGDRFAFGAADATTAPASLEVVEVRAHPSLDIALARLATSSAEALPAVAAIPWLTSAIDATWLGRPVEGAGYGVRENGERDLRKFIAEPVVAVTALTFTVDGGGEHGLCGGDSGGPALVMADDGTLRIAGVLSGGSATCVDQDHFARADVASAWIESVVGAAPPAPAAPCGGGLDTRGRCVAGGAVALHCDEHVVRAEPCGAEEVCGWNEAAAGFRCVVPPDPCGGVDALGTCESGVARWCDGGETRQRDCGGCGELCTIDLAVGGATCVPDPCADLDHIGRCDGEATRVWCVDDERFEEDCAAQGATCRFVNDTLGYQCA